MRKVINHICGIRLKVYMKNNMLCEVVSLSRSSLFSLSSSQTCHLSHWSTTTMDSSIQCITSLSSEEILSYMLQIYQGEFDVGIVSCAS